MNQFSAACNELSTWLDNSIDSGWLPKAAQAALDDVEKVTADTLFSIDKRPLLVAFFGGTGVGKSSLLNRLAGRDVATVGAIRPTSHHVTLYLHEDYKNSLHEETLPTESTRIVYHQDEKRKYFAWIDMPDIDSTEQHNREIVTRWLPVIDWLIYVVTPERYQDEQGWEFVQARGGKHNWLFVINHWDQGKQSQRADFTQKLIAQGFTDPVVLTTSCNAEVETSSDEFDQLEQILNASLSEQGLSALQDLANKRQWYFLGQAIDQLSERIVQPVGWDDLQAGWTQTSQQALDAIHLQLMTNAERVYQQWKIQGEGNKNVLPELAKIEKKQGSSIDPLPLNTVYDQRTSSRLEMLGLTLENQFTSRGFSTMIINDKLPALILESEQSFLESIDRHLRKALLKPGNMFTRLVFKLMRFLQWALPLCVALWVGYHVLSGFNKGLEGESDFLGVNFLTHSAFMIGLSWLIPWLVKKQFRPSYADTAFQGVKKGIENAQQYSKELLQESWDKIAEEKRRRSDELKDIQQTYQRELQSARQLPEKYMSLPSKGSA